MTWHVVRRVLASLMIVAAILLMVGSRLWGDPSGPFPEIQTAFQIAGVLLTLGWALWSYEAESEHQRVSAVAAAVLAAASAYFTADQLKTGSSRCSTAATAQPCALGNPAHT